MCQFVESIKVSEGKAWNLMYHQARMERTFAAFHPGKNIPLLQKILENKVSAYTGLHKCRVLYSDCIKGIEFVPYAQRNIRNVRLVYTDKLDYSFKYLNRDVLNMLYSGRDSCDDILIVKENCVTDAFSSNVIFTDGENWFTPDTPLLEGTTRERLLQEGIITERRISVSDLGFYKGFQLINAMNDFNESVTIGTDAIFH